MDYTVFITYAFESISGFTKAIHSNKIKSLQLLDTDNPYIAEISINFPNIGDFKFLSDSINSGTGYTVQKIYALVQLVSGTTGVTPVSSEWKIYDVTDQTSGYTSGQSISGGAIYNTIYKVSLYTYNSKPTYNLDYLTYPATVETDKLCFGEETYFLGNITTDIEAIVFTTDLSVNLLLNEFNSSSNSTWDGTTPVAISEVGIYDENKNLVAIGKLNNPISKDSTISRTIVFALDF